MSDQFQTGIPSVQQNGSEAKQEQPGAVRRQSLWRPRELEQRLHHQQAQAAISDTHSLDNDLIFMG